MVSLRRSMAFSLGGNVVYNASQFLLIVVLARLGSADLVGQYAFAQAIAAPVYLFVGLNLRAVRATDTAHRWSAAQYAQLRLLLNLASWVAVLVIAFVLGLRGSALAVVLVLALGKGSEATSQLLYGHFQAHDRLDLVSRSLLLRALGGVVAFTVAMTVWGSLVTAVAAQAAAWLVVYAFHDRRNEAVLRQDDDMVTSSTLDAAATIGSLARTAFPLGLDAGAGSLVNTIPRFAVQAALGSRGLGLFAALAYLGQVVQLVTGSLADAVISRLARAAQARDRRAFTSTLTTLLAFGVGVSTVVLLLAALVGDAAVRVLLGPQYVDTSLMLLILAAAAVTTLQRIIGRGLQATLAYRAVLAMNMVNLLICAVAVPTLVAVLGVDGAALGLAASFAGSSVVGAIVLRARIRRITPEAGGPDR